MAKKYNVEQQQAIYNEKQNRIDAIRRTSISNNDNEKCYLTQKNLKIIIRLSF